ncbi:uncharacterized protein DUF1616 [Krasilnikovia cinnamomea]|uniref:Uncharacterized protein DUF1616 n=1 Tax=Krasilnikovia cinnamomea TaxID=349313 RepID=A0A4Q7ZE62_9ACTN|nr:DUF1616 domain-containing protein [Krasilnikovia cinnamomea]RZU48393.1 uncharacterized protein DUF1616 [Krasilnikovia cinnamomea]
MKPKLAILLAVVTVAAAAAVLFGSQPLMIAGGVLLALLLPGAALTGALLRGRDLSGVERTVLTSALSLGVLILGGLVIHVLGFSLGRTSWTVATAGVTLVALVPAGLPDRWVSALHRLVSKLWDEEEDEPEPEPADAVAPPVAVAAGAPTVGAPTVAAPTPVLTEDQVSTMLLPRVVDDGPSADATDAAGPRRLAWQLLPLVLVLAVLGGASWLSYSSSHSSYETTVTALSAGEPGPVTASGNRLVPVTATGLVPEYGPYTLAVVGPTGKTAEQRTIPVSGDGTWRADISMPGRQRMTVNLLRAGETSPYRTLYIAAAR